MTYFVILTRDGVEIGRLAISRLDYDEITGLPSPFVDFPHDALMELSTAHHRYRLATARRDG